MHTPIYIFLGFSSITGHAQIMFFYIEIFIILTDFLILNANWVIKRIKAYNIVISRHRVICKNFDFKRNLVEYKCLPTKPESTLYKREEKDLFETLRTHYFQY